MAIGKNYEDIEDFIKAVQSSTAKEVFILGQTANEKGEPVSRTLTDDKGVPTEAVIMPSQKLTNGVVLSYENTVSAEGARETCFFLYSEVINSELVVNEEEFAQAIAKKEGRIGEIHHLFAEKCPEITLVKGRVMPI